MKKCFVVCPIGPEASDIRKRSDQVYKHLIVPACEETGYEAIRVDKIHDADTITQTIIQHLRDADLVITDLTDQNPNVFFETGFRSALGKPMIQLIQEGQTLPFDVAALRTINYLLTDPDKNESVKNKLVETIKTVTVTANDPNVVKDDTGDNVNSQILSLLLGIKDSIESLKTSVETKSRADMESVVSALAGQMQKSNVPAEHKMLEILLPELLNNPKKFAEISTVFENINNQSK